MEDHVEEYEVVGAFMSKEDVRYIAEVFKESKEYASSTLRGRRAASHVLSFVAQMGESGNVHDLVTPEMVGHAVARLVSNYTEDESWLPRFLVGLGGCGHS